MGKKATPKKQASNPQSSSRYKTYQNRARKRLVNSTKLSKCSKCKEAKLAHTVCTNCGEHKGRQVLNMEKQVDKITKVKA